MASLSEYKSLEKKNNSFKVSSRFPENRIVSEEQFEDWYERWTKRCKERAFGSYFFRGMTEARYKLFTSAQRLWIEKLSEERVKKIKYRDFFKTMLVNAQNHPVLSRVFKSHKLTTDELSFPALSIIQHYGGRSPLMDWSHDLDVALYFAMEKVKGIYNANDINSYASVYRINNKKTGLRPLHQISTKAFPSFNTLMEQFRKGELSPDRLFYFSDFVEPFHSKPFTTLYNQNIIPQKGLFIFNPSRTNSLEDYFPNGENDFAQIRCYNIHKNLAGYISKKIKAKGITKSFIYPNLNKIISSVNKKTVSTFFNL